MSDRSSIEWCDASWNPLRARNLRTSKVGWHCQKVSPGCTNCYAERLNRRLGTGRDYKPLGDIGELFLDEKTLIAPLGWRKPRRVFVCSMTDLFGEWVPDQWIDQIFAVMALAPQHSFQVLTKRADRMREYVSEPGRLSEVVEAAAALSFDEVSVAGRSGEPLQGTTLNVSDDPEDPEIRVASPRWPLSNCWLGVSAEDQERLDERVPELLATPAAVRFVSAEPLIGPLRFDRIPIPKGELGLKLGTQLLLRRQDYGLDWLIIGGESGPGARPMDIAWARDIVRQCREAQVPVFCKQLGARPVMAEAEWRAAPRLITPKGRDLGEHLVQLALEDRKGGAMEEWPEDLRVREFPEVRP